MKTSIKVILAAAFAGTLALGGLVKVGHAQSPVAVMQQSQKAIQIAEAGETNDDEQEKSESQLQNLAKITPQQAKQAAETAVGGTATKVKLENENGSLIYAVEIGSKELTIDAGNGKVLSSENLGQGDKAEESAPKSSIQVP